MKHAWLNRSARVVAIAALSTLLAACGSGGSSAPPPAPPPATVGPAGGTVNGPSGAQVVIPAGALSAATAIAVDQSSTGAPALPAGMSSFGAMFAFTPHGTSFAAPVTVTVPFNAAAVPAGATPALYKTTGTGTWERVSNATVNAGTVTAQVTSFSWLIVGNVPPIITTQPANASVVEPATASFSVVAIGTPPFSYQWQKSDDGGQTFNDIPAATAASYTTPATSAASDNGDRFRVRVSNLEGASTSQAATLTVTVNVVAPAITTQPQNQSVAAGASATFSAVASGTAPSYQWQRSGDGTNWTDLAGATNASYTLANVQATDNGALFRVRATNSAGTATSNAASLTVTTAPPPTSRARIAAAGTFSLAVLANGNVVSWGSDASGTLGAGPGDQTRTSPGATSASNVAQVVVGGSHALALLNDGSYRGWGYNGFGQLGDGSNLSREAPVNPPFNYNDAVDACGGTLHSMILRANGTVRAFGYNMDGQLGDGTNTTSSASPYSVAVSGISTATAIACRGNHSLALLADGTVRAWGANGVGQLGDGSTANRNTPVAVSGLTNVIAIAAGTDHSLALRADGSVWAWGSNINGKLGDGTSTNRLVPTPTLLTSGITAIVAGGENSLALRGADGAVLSWGINETGQLGSGSLSPGFRPTPAPVVSLTGVVAIAFGTGLGHGLAVRSDGTVWAWGDNFIGFNNTTPVFGKLGTGSQAGGLTTPAQVTGLNLN